MSTITVVKITREQLDRAFAEAKSQNDYLYAIYALVIPEWTPVARVNSHPMCNRETWVLICELAAAWDAKLNETRVCNAHVLPGGAWMNSGFSTDLTLGFMEVCYDEAMVERQASILPT